MLHSLGLDNHIIPCPITILDVCKTVCQVTGGNHFVLQLEKASLIKSTWYPVVTSSVPGQFDTFCEVSSKPDGCIHLQQSQRVKGSSSCRHARGKAKKKTLNQCFKHHCGISIVTKIDWSWKETVEWKWKCTKFVESYPSLTFQVVTVLYSSTVVLRFLMHISLASLTSKASKEMARVRVRIFRSGLSGLVRILTEGHYPVEVRITLNFAARSTWTLTHINQTIIHSFTL